jgi:hypothetical protein
MQVNQKIIVKKTSFAVLNGYIVVIRTPLHLTDMAQYETGTKIKIWPLYQSLNKRKVHTISQ